jgi:hypothetical protein
MFLWERDQCLLLALNRLRTTVRLLLIKSPLIIEQHYDTPGRQNGYCDEKPSSDFRH